MTGLISVTVMVPIDSTEFRRAPIEAVALGLEAMAARLRAGDGADAFQVAAIEDELFVPTCRNLVAINTLWEEIPAAASPRE